MKRRTHYLLVASHCSTSAVESTAQRMRPLTRPACCVSYAAMALAVELVHGHGGLDQPNFDVSSRGWGAWHPILEELSALIDGRGEELAVGGEVASGRPVWKVPAGRCCNS